MAGTPDGVFRMARTTGTSRHDQRPHPGGAAHGTPVGPRGAGIAAREESDRGEGAGHR